MHDDEATATPDLIAGRECGPCTVCCTALTIDEAELQKPQGYRCRHLSPHGGCGIYPTRPRTCRTFYCGWRVLKWVKEPLRPDRSGVLIMQHGEVSKQTGRRSMGIMIGLLTPGSVKAEGLAETVAAAVAADVPVYVHIPGPPGFTAATARINEALRDAVLTRDKPGVLRILREIRNKGLSDKRKFIPVVLTGRGGGPPAD